jgi:myo-inositol-1(or 4)-monophosphatase
MGGNLFTACAGNGAWWNGRPMSVSEQPGLDGAFLATGYPFKARNTLGRYLEVFRDVFHHAKAIRRCGAAALDLAYVAAGVYDGFFEFRLSPWDFAAGDILIREAGGTITNLDGGVDFYRQGNLVAGTPEVHRGLLRVMDRLVSEEILAADVESTIEAGSSP